MPVGREGDEATRLHSVGGRAVVTRFKHRTE